MSHQRKYQKAGFTLLETVVALCIFCLISISATAALSYASSASARLAVKGELFENARIAVDFLTVHIQAADTVTLQTSPSGTLQKLTVWEDDDMGAAEQHVFQYHFDAAETVKYHRLEFGGNEVASYIADIYAAADNGVLTLRVTSDDRLNREGGPVAEPVVLTAKIPVYNKLN